MLRVTIDTNVLDADKVERIGTAVEGLDVEIKTTTVTLREDGRAAPPAPPSSPPVAETGVVYDESHYDSGAIYAGGGGVIYETWVLGESPLGSAVLGDDDAPSRFEAILHVIGTASFPKLGLRDSMTPGQKRQLRDAMILEAHAREGRDVLISDDRKGFIGKDGENRRRLEALCATKIMTVDEFCDYAASLGRA